MRVQNTPMNRFLGFFPRMTHTRIVKVEVQSTSGVQIKLMKADDAFAATAGPRLTEPLVGRDSPLLPACGGPRLARRLRGRVCQVG